LRMRLKTFITSHASSTKRHVTMTNTGHSRNVGPHYGTCFKQPSGTSNFETVPIFCSETSAKKHNMPGNKPKTIVNHSEHGESLKFRIKSLCTVTKWQRSTTIHKKIHEVVRPGRAVSIPVSCSGDISRLFSPMLLLSFLGS
jgi:hypothetical protein